MKQKSDGEVLADDIRAFAANYIKSDLYHGSDKGLQLMFLEFMSDAGLIKEATRLFECMDDKKRDSILINLQEQGIVVPESIIKSFF